MKAYLKTEIRNGFIFTEENLVKLNDICKKRMLEKNIYDKMQYKIYRADSLLYETNDYNIISKEENSKRNYIKSLSLFVKEDILDFNLSFDKKEFISLSIETDDKDFGYLLYSDLKDYITTEIAKLRKFEFSKRLFPIMSFLLIVAMMFILFNSFRSPLLNDYEFSQLLKSGSIENKLNNILLENRQLTDYSSIKLILPILFIGFIIFFFFGKMLDKLYPLNIFYWGKEAIKYDRIVNIRGKLIWGIIIAFVISTAASLIIFYITK